MKAVASDSEKIFRTQGQLKVVKEQKNTKLLIPEKRSIVRSKESSIEIELEAS